jgi:hypothetical protein
MFVVMVLALMLAVFGLLQSSVRIGGRGTVKVVGVGVFWDGSCTDPVSAIDWGMVEPGSVNNVTVYVRNEGNVASNISLTVENWNPLNASDYFILTWDYDCEQLNPREVAQTTLTLSVSQSVHGIESFSFDIVFSVCA